MRITYSARCWVAAIMLPITSIAKGAVDFVDCMLITDLSDPIFLHHTATGAPLEAEDEHVHREVDDEFIDLETIY